VAYVDALVTPTATYIGLCGAIRSSNQPRWRSIDCNSSLSCSSAAKYTHVLVRTLSPASATLHNSHGASDYTYGARATRYATHHGLRGVHMNTAARQHEQRVLLVGEGWKA
jgi:hypothetical protein